MLGEEAQKIAAAIEDRVNTGAAGGRGVTATVETQRSQPAVIPTGAGRPTFIRYNIRVSDGARAAALNVSQAAELLDGIEPGWDADRLFDAIRSRDVLVEDASPEPGGPPGGGHEPTTGTTAGQ